jgi:hypothetical protein
VARRPTRRERMRLVAAIDATIKEAKARFGPQLNAIAAEMKAAGRDHVRVMALQARFDALVLEQQTFAEADLYRRLHPDDNGSETVDA